MRSRSLARSQKQRTISAVSRWQTWDSAHIISGTKQKGISAKVAEQQAPEITKAARTTEAELAVDAFGQCRRTAPRSAARPLSAVWGTRYVGPVNKPGAVPHLEAVEMLAHLLLKSGSGFLD